MQLKQKIAGLGLMSILITSGSATLVVEADLAGSYPITEAKPADKRYNCSKLAFYPKTYSKADSPIELYFTDTTSNTECAEANRPYIPAAYLLGTIASLAGVYFAFREQRFKPRREKQKWLGQTRWRNPAQ